MAHTKNCQSCGTTITGNINRRFCTDACRKYYKAHGNIGQSGLSVNRLNKSEKSGEKRKSSSSSVGDYAVKRLIDFAGKMAENQLISPNSEQKQNQIAGLNTQTPLRIATISDEIHTGRQPGQYRPLLSPTLQQFLGELTHPFQMLIWGLPGSGKSTMSMIMANEMAAFRKVLYVSNEEELTSATLRQKQARTITRPKQFSFANRLPYSPSEWRLLLFPSTPNYTPSQSVGKFLSAPGQSPASAGRLANSYPEYRTIVYDSITTLKIHPFHVKATANDCQLPAFGQHISHIFISHAHKDGKEYRGDGSWGHEVDIIIRCHEGVATIQKNRFATAEQGRIGTEYKIY